MFFCDLFFHVILPFFFAIHNNLIDLYESCTDEDLTFLCALFVDYSISFS